MIINNSTIQHRPAVLLDEDRKLRLFNNCKSKGFTLIELLTVIAIIGILTAFLTVSYIAVRQRARDTQRKSDLKQMQSALELYKADTDAYPPSSPSSPFNPCGGPFTYNSIQYMSKVPCDSLNTTTPYYYFQPSGTITYVIVACAENTNDKDALTLAQANGLLPAGATLPICNPAYYFLYQNP